MQLFSPSKVLFLLAVVVGTFLLPLYGTLRAETVQAPADTSASGELVFWNSIKKSETAADFEIYLKTFPDGMFADIAKTRYQELGGTGAVAMPKVEEAVVAEPEVKEAVVEEPEQDVVMKKTKKRAQSVFVKKKKPKVILAYTKDRAKRKSKYAATKPTRKYVKKVKRPVVVKVKYAKPKPAVAKKKIYQEPASGSGGGGGGSGGGGGGWGG